MEIWPAIDLRGGKCVRLRQGDYRQETVFGDDPAAMARHWVDLGAKCLHLVDLDGAFSGQPSLELVRRVAEAAGGVPLQVGGGYRSTEMVAAALEAGAARVMVGTAAASPEFLAHAAGDFGEGLVVAIDVRDGKVALRGWTELSELDAADLARACAEAGVRRLLVTSTRRDGSLAGPDFELIRSLLDATQLPLIAAGGVATLDDLLALRDFGCEGAIAGAAIWSGRFTLAEALRAISAQAADESP